MHSPPIKWKNILNFITYKNISMLPLFIGFYLFAACSDLNLDQLISDNKDIRQSSGKVLDATISSIDIVDGKITVQTSHTETIKSVTVINPATGKDILIIGSDNLDAKIAQAIEELALNNSDTIQINLVTDSGEKTFEITTNKSGEEFVSVSYIEKTDIKNGSDPSSTAGGNSDNTPPTVTIGSPSLTIADSSDTVTYTITYEVAPSPELVSGDISFGGTDPAGCSVSNIANAATTSPVISISGCTGDGNVNISVLAGKSADAAGNTAVCSFDITVIDK